MKAVFWAMLTALFWGGASILEKTGLKQVDPLTAVTWRSLALTVCLFSYNLAVRGTEKLVQVDWRSLAFIIGAGIFSGLLAQITYFTALKNGEVSRVVPIAGSYPLVAALLAFVILGEKLTWAKFLGVILIIAGVFLLK